VAARYKPLTLDEESQAFIDSCQPSYLRSLAATVLRMMYSLTDTNAILNRALRRAWWLVRGCCRSDTPHFPFFPQAVKCLCCLRSTVWSCLEHTSDVGLSCCGLAVLFILRLTSVCGVCVGLGQRSCLMLGQAMDT